MIRFIIVALLCGASLFSTAQTINTALFQYAQQAPKTNNIEVLTNYLQKGVQNETELATLLAYWMMDNIAYDVKSYVSGSYPSTDWETTLRSKKAVCSGYANLYQELCNRVNLPCEVVSGYAKGFGYKKDTKFNRSNHAWNFVEVDGESFLMDITWASGYVEYKGSQLKFVKFSKPEKLFALPEVFIEDHLPIQTRWQLLNHPVSFDKYLQFSTAQEMIDSTSTFFNYTDSIEAYMRFSEIEQETSDVNTMALVNPQDQDIPHYYERIAYKLTRDTDNKQQLELAKKFYQKAKLFYRKTTNQKRCTDGIKYADFYLSKM